MATAAQVLANRWNARKSTGPRTAEGKAKVAQNAVKHGLLAREVVIQGEDPGQFEFYRDQMLGDLAPAGPVEATLSERIVSLSWRLQRAERLQNAALAVLCQENGSNPHGGPGVEDDPLALGRVVVKDFGYGTSALDRLLLYERRIEHSLYRTMGELQKLRLMRELEPPAAERVAERGEVVGSVPIRAYDEVSSVKSEVSSGDPALQTARLTLPTCASTRESTAANTAAVSAQTESPGPSEEVGRGRPSYEEGSDARQVACGNPETPDGVTTNLPARAAAPSETLDHSSTQRFRDSSPGSGPLDVTGQSCETKPIGGDSDNGQVARGAEAQNGLPQGERGETNPISPSFS
jgi:hypothetical protein